MKLEISVSMQGSAVDDSGCRETVRQGRRRDEKKGSKARATNGSGQKLNCNESGERANQ